MELNHWASRGADGCIGSKFLHQPRGYGGSCFRRHRADLHGTRGQVPRWPVTDKIANAPSVKETRPRPELW